MNSDVRKEPKSGIEYLQIDNQSKTLVCLFHGYGASMMDLYGMGEVIQTNEKVDWIFPNGVLGLQMGIGMMSRAWFPIDMVALEEAMQAGTHRNFSDAYTEEFENVLKTTQIFFNELKLKYDKIILGGFSQGSMVTTHLALNNSKDVTGLLSFSGALIGRKQIYKLTENTHKFPFIQSHGKQDPVLSYYNAKELFEILKVSGHQGEFISFDGAHEIPNIVIQRTSEFINRVLK